MKFQYDQRLTDEAKKAMVEFKLAVYNLYANYDVDVMNVNKPQALKSLWELHNDIQTWGMVDENGLPEESAQPFTTDEEVDEIDFIELDDQMARSCVINIDEDLPLMEYISRITSSLTHNCELEIGGSDRYNYSVDDVMTILEAILRAGEYDFDAYKSLYVDHILVRTY